MGAVSTVLVRTSAVAYVLAAVVVLGVSGALVPIRPYLSLATIVLIDVLIVFLIAIRLGRGPSMLSSVLAVLSADYFFTEPYHRLTVASSQDVVALIVLLIVAEMTSRLVTDRLRLQREAAQAEILRRADELKSTLLSAVSHDLRTPLSSIRMAATALLQEDVAWKDEARRDLLETIDSEAARLSRLVGNLLDFSRIEAGALHPAKELRDVQEVVARAVDAAHDRLRMHRVAVDVAGDLPLVPIDFTMIENVLVNLLDNSARNAPEGTEIRVAAGSGDGQLIVRVENDGPAVPAAMADEIFQRFSSAARRQGTGLGLAICKGLVEAHGGRIWVDRPGEPGARFVFSLPLPAVPRSVGETPAVKGP